MGSTSLQPDQFSDRLISLPLSTSLEILAKEDQGNDQGCGVIEGDGANDLWKESRHNAQNVSCCRAKRNQRIHIRAAVAQRFDGPPVKLPTYDSPDRGSERQQEIVLAWKPVHKKHAENHNRQHENYTQDEQIALADDLCLFPSTLLILLCNTDYMCVKRFGYSAGCCPLCWFQ